MRITQYQYNPGVYYSFKKIELLLLEPILE